MSHSLSALNCLLWGCHLLPPYRKDSFFGTQTISFFLWYKVISCSSVFPAGGVGLYDSLTVSRVASRQRSVNSLHLPNTVPGKTFVCTADYHSSCKGHLKLNKGDLVTGKLDLIVCTLVRPMKLLY